MSNFPTKLDDDVTLPRVDDNVTEIRGDIINALRHAIFNIQAEIGIGARGSKDSLADRIGISLNPDGSLKGSIISSIISSMGPIRNEHIAANANISESKLNLNHSTSDLNSSLLALRADTERVLSFISLDGSKINPHLQGEFAHTLNHIKVGPSASIKNRKDVQRGDNALLVVQSLNNEFVLHQKLEGKDGEGYYAHHASGIGLKTDTFSYIDKDVNDLQGLANFIDRNTLSLLGTRTQTLYQNGIPRSSRSFPTNSAILDDYLKYNPIVPSTNKRDGYISAILGSDSGGQINGKVNGGQLIVPPTKVTTTINSSDPDSILASDDVVVFQPEGTDNYAFYKMFSNIMVGDLLTINYKNSGESNSVVSSFIVQEAKCVWSGSNQTYVVRINGKNLFQSANAVATVNRPNFNTNKYGVLALAPIPTKFVGSKSGIIVGDPRGAQVLGHGFNPTQFGPNNYNLYLCMYPRSNPNSSESSSLFFPVQIKPIDVTGNAGATPGSYTLDSIVEQTNIAFQRSGFNLRFIAFTHNGEFGIMLADPYNGAAFSIIAGVVGSNGDYDPSASSSAYPKNVIDAAGIKDPLGFGPLNANVASPPYVLSETNPKAAGKPTKIFAPSKRNNFYVNGAEKDKISDDVSSAFLQQEEDENGDGYWLAEIHSRTPIASGRVEVTYRVNGKLLPQVDLRRGKTIVVQPHLKDVGLVQDFGRFFIQNVDRSSSDGIKITVYDAVHNAGSSPYPTSQPGTKVRIYFSNNTVLFSQANAFDVNHSPGSSTFLYNRSFEIFSDENGSVNAHERARFVSGYSGLPRADLKSDQEIQNVDIVRVSPKLLGYEFSEAASSALANHSSSLRKITLAIKELNSQKGTFTGYLCRLDGTSASNLGSEVTGKFGETVRFYDESSINYIDFCFSLNKTHTAITGATKYIDIQIFPTISSNQEIMLIGTLQLDKNNDVSYLRDERQFGNVSEKQFSNSAINFIESSSRLLHENGVVSGFDVKSNADYQIRLAGGTCIVNGKVIQIINSSVFLPGTKEKITSSTSGFITWFLCADQNGKLILIPSTDYRSPIDRVVNADFSASSNYYMYSSTLRNLVIRRKDLLPLYVVYRDASTSVTSVNFIDIRKFAYKQGGSSKITVSAEDGVGNFKSLDAAIEYVKLNGSLEREIHLRSDTQKDVPYTLDFSSENGSIEVAGARDRATITLNQNATITGSAQERIRFINCSVLFNGPSTSIERVDFVGCRIIFNSTTTTTIRESKFNNCIIVINNPITCNQMVNFQDCNVDVSSSVGIKISSNVNISGCVFNYVYSHSSSNSSIINLGNALIYGDVNAGSGLSDVVISNNKFNSKYDEDIFYPFIAIRLKSDTVAAASCTNLSIVKNTFTSRNEFSYRAAIVIHSDGPTPSGKYPKLADSAISENTCNYDQSIILTDSTLNANCPIVASNVYVKNNICGIIGFVTAASSDGKSSSLIVIENKVKLIANIDSSGKSVAYSATTGSLSASTGFVSIERNMVNWISVSSNNAPEAIRITSNKATPASINLLTESKVNDGVQGPFQVKNQAISCRLYGSSANSSIISENNIYSDGTVNYYDAAIHSDGYSQIIGNSIFGCVKNPNSTTYNPIVSLGSRGGFLVANNNINRNGLTVDCFIVGPGETNTNKAIIVNNLLIGVSATEGPSKKKIPSDWYDSSKNTEW
jgi:hypothetical protein